MANEPTASFANKLKASDVSPEDRAKAADVKSAEDIKAKQAEIEKVAVERAKEDTKQAEEKQKENKDAAEAIAAGKPREGEQPVVVNKDTDVPDSEKAGSVLPSSSTIGADDARPGTSDTAAESSTLTKNALDSTFGRGPSPQDRLSTDPVDISIDQAKANATKDTDVRYFYTGRPSMTFGAGPKGDKRVSFVGRVLATADQEVIKYIQDNFLDRPGLFRVEEISEDQYRENRSHGNVVPTHISIEDPRDVADKVVLEPHTAVTARKPRTEQDPRVLGLPETGNAQQDHFTQGEKLIAEERPGTSTGNIQLQRNKAELDAAGGKGVASDSRANPAPPAQQTGMTNSINMRPVGAPKK